MTAEQKNDVVVRFLQGESATDISAFYALTRSSVEELLRQAMLSLLRARETANGMALCSACGQAYVPRRKPRAQGRHYCGACGHAAALRDAKADYRARRRMADVVDVVLTDGR